MHAYKLDSHIRIIAASLAIYNYSRKHVKYDEESGKVDHGDDYMPFVLDNITYENMYDSPYQTLWHKKIALWLKNVIICVRTVIGRANRGSKPM